MPPAQSVPRSFFHAGRAQCPDCGAALELAEDHPTVTCHYCGGTAVVERRLRTIEPTIDGEIMTADAPLGAARTVMPSQAIPVAVAEDESHCPGCGMAVEAPPGTQVIRRCTHCLTQCKIERRLARSPEVEEALLARDRDLPAHERKQFDATEALLVTVETSTDLPTRVRAAWELGEFWIHANARAARLLPRVMTVLRTAGDSRVEQPLAELVGKLLCNDDVVLSNAVLRAAEKFTFDVDGSPTLLRQLSLGSGVGLKLLLDTADFAATRGAIHYACYALWSIGTMIERHYADRMRLADVILYRLLYLRGPAQAWALEVCQGQAGLGCRFPEETLLRFMGDCAAERPEFLPQIEKCFYQVPPGAPCGKPDPAFDAQLQAWMTQWNDGIRAVVSDYHARQQLARDYWQTIQRSSSI